MDGSHIRGGAADAPFYLPQGDECEIFAAAYRAYGLATVRYPVVQVTAQVMPFDNGAGFTLQVVRVEKPHKQN